MSTMYVEQGRRYAPDSYSEQQARQLAEEERIAFIAEPSRADLVKAVKVLTQGHREVEARYLKLAEALHQTLHPRLDAALEQLGEQCVGAIDEGVELLGSDWWDEYVEGEG